MANGKDRISDSDLTAAVDEILSAGDSDSIVGVSARQAKMTSILFRRILPPLFRAVNRMRALPPWVMQLASGVGITGLVAVGIFIVNLNAKACTTEQDLNRFKTEVKAELDKTEAQIRPLYEASARTDASLRLLLRARGLDEPTEHELQRSRRALGLDSLADTITARHGP